MTPSVLPVRTEVRCVSADELAEINRARPTKKRFLPFDEISDLLLRAQITSFSHDEIQRLADHPDERVPIALIRMRNSLLHRQDAQKFVDRHSSIWRTLSERAVREADREGVLWTPLLDACIDSPDSRLLNDSHAFQAVSDRFDNLLFIVQNATDPRVLEPLAGFHSARIRDLQLTEARTIPEHLLSYWIRNAKHAIQILKNQPLMARHGPAVLSRIFDLPTNELDIRLIAELREVDPKDLEHAPQGWTNRIIQRALAKKSDPALDALESVFDALPDVTEQMIRRIVQVAERRRSRQMDVSYHPAAYPALLHPACPPDLRQRLLDGEFGFPHAILSHASTDAEILDAAWRHVGFKVSDHVLNHPNVSMETALSIVRTQVASPLYSWPPFFPGAAARPAIAVAYLDRWDTLDPKRFPSADHQKRAWDLASLLGHLFGQTTIVEGDPWLNLATSLAFRNLAYATFATPDDYKVLGHAIEHFRQMAERLHPTLDQNVVARCLQMPEKIFREQMSRCLVHISLQPGLIDRELPRWHAWANQIVSEHLNMTTSRGLRVVLSTMR